MLLQKLLSRICEILNNFRNIYLVTKIVVFTTYFVKKTYLLYARGDVFIVMCTKFQVDTFKNGVFKAFQRLKMVAFQDIPMHYHAFVFRFYT